MSRFYQGIYYDNLGISYSAGTFTINGADGRALSALNPAVVVLPSKASPGLFVEYQIEANQSFIDDAGASQIIGNLFGFTTGVAITVDVPFFIYAVCNDNEDAIAFMISRVPGLTSSPTATTWISNLGSTASVNNQSNFFSLRSITVGDYNGNPSFCLGSFRMKMSASDDWTVQTLVSSSVFGEGNADGFGYYQTGYPYQIPKGQLGSDSGSLVFSNGGTAATFSTSLGFYRFIGNVPELILTYYFSGDGGTDGSGAVNAKFLVPFTANIGSGTAQQTGGTMLLNNITYNETAVCIHTTNQIYFTLYRATGSTSNWADFGNGSRTIYGNTQYNIGTA